MKLTDLLSRDRVQWDVPVASKKRALETISNALCRDRESLTPADVFDALIHRERLGCTNLGDAIALPHARVAGLRHCVGTLIRVTSPIPFDGVDPQPVRLLLGIVCPIVDEADCEHSGDIMTQVARLLTQSELGQQLLEANSADEAWERILRAERANEDAAAHPRQAARRASG